jgi:peptidyl-prolyl cis-trans isomerase C
LPFEQVEGAIAAALEAQVTARALRQYVEVLAGQAELEAVDLAGAASPLVQ